MASLTALRFRLAGDAADFGFGEFTPFFHFLFFDITVWKVLFCLVLFVDFGFDWEELCAEL
jgi:hypothetical protein